MRYGTTKLRFGQVMLFMAMSLGQLQCSFMPEELKAFYDLPLPNVEHKRMVVEGITMSYVQAGNPSGTPVMFIHGSPGSWEDWKLVLTRPELQPRFKLIAVDRPGWGRHENLSIKASTVSIQSQLLGPVLESVALGEKVVLVGHSLGGPIVVRMAIDFPNRVAAIILLAPSLDPDLDAVLWFNHLASYTVVQWFLPDVLLRSNEEILVLPEELRSLARQMATLHIPVLVVHGLKDTLVDPGNAAFARHNFSQAVYRETLLDNFGHLIPQLRPGEVVLSILSAAEMAVMP